MQASGDTTGRTSSDTQALMLFDANKKSLLVAYLLWWFFGFAGGHRFYFKKSGSAVAQLALFIGGAVTLIVGVGFLLLAGLVVWVFVDAFLIPGWANKENSSLAMQLGGRNSHVYHMGAAHARAADWTNADDMISRYQAREQAAVTTPSAHASQPPQGFGRRVA